MAFYPPAYKAAVDMQRLLLADAKKEECNRRERCLIARAYRELEELKLRLRMKGPPKAVDASKVAKRSIIPIIEVD